MWLLTIFSTFLIHAMLMAGVILLACSAFLGAIAFFRTYKFPMQLLGFILLGAGLYYEGALAHKASQAVAVANLEFKLANAQAKSAKTNTIIVEKIVKDTQVIREKGKTITEYVDREVIKYNNTCVLPKEVIKAHNMAATLNTDSLTIPKGDKK